MSNKQKRYLEEKLIHKTIRGEMVRSKSEVIVANILDKININYSYEEPFDVSGKTYIPYFTLHYHGKTAYLEHIGTRKELFESVGISKTLENLIITEDGYDGSLDATLIESKIQK